MKQSEWLFNKTQTVSSRGIVGTKHAEASKAGAEMLQRGGNAIDAAVAAAFASGVVEPWMNGIGGGGLMVIHLAKQKRTVTIDFGMHSGSQARPDMFPLEPGYHEELFSWRKVTGDQNIHGYKSVAVPGTVAGLSLALEKFGTLDLKTVLAPAIRLAEEGFPIEWYSALRIAMDAANIAKYPETVEIFFQNGFPRVPSQTVKPVYLKQPNLARTLRSLAENGAQSFYEGDLAQTITQTIQAHGGILTADDFANYKPRLYDGGLSISYNGHQIVTTPPPSGGPTLAETFLILDGFNIGAYGHNSAAALHHFAESARLAFADRFEHLRDPEGGASWEWLLSPEYIRKQQARVHQHEAMHEVSAGLQPDGSTTHLCAVDGEHNMVALTQTLLSVFGSRVTIGDTGILMNNGMMWFNPEPGHANSVAPNRRPLCNMAPMVVLKGGTPLLALGSSGGRKIINANAQIALNVMLYGMQAQAAIDAPRIDCSTPQVEVDDRIPASTIEQLRKWGHNIIEVHEAVSPKQFASPVAISIDPDSGLIYGGIDPYNQGTTVGL